MRYGKQEALKDSFNEYFTRVRSMYLTPEAKRRIMLGTFTRMAGYRDAYYLKATKVRTLIIEEHKMGWPPGMDHEELTIGLSQVSAELIS